MPKDTRNTLAAFDDLLASLEGIVDDDGKGTSSFGGPVEPQLSPSSVDSEFYDFYFEINNVPRKASSAPPTSNTNLPPPPPALSPQPPYYSSTHHEVTPAQLPSSPPLSLLPPPPPTAPPVPPPAPSTRNPPPPPAIRNPPPPAPVAPVHKPQIGIKPKPPQQKSQLKLPSKPNPNKSNLSLKKPGAKPKGSALRVNPPMGTPTAPYEAPQRFLSRGSYNSGASQVDSSPPPPPKEISPQRFMSTGSYISPPSNPPPLQLQPGPAPSITPFTSAKEPPQRFYTTNNFISRPQPTSSPTPPQRFMSTNAPNKNSYDADVPARNSYIGNRPSRNSPAPQFFKQPTSEPYNPPPPQPYNPPRAFSPSQPYNPPQAHNPPQPYNPPAPSYYPTNPHPHHPPSPSSQYPSNSSHSPSHSSSNAPSSSYYPSSPSPSYPSDNDYDRGGNSDSSRLSSINSRKSIRMPKSSLPKAANNLCGKCGNHIDGEHVMAMNKFWCLDHFTCRDCNTPLHGVFSEENGHPHCSDCMSNKYQCVTCGRGVTTGQFYQTENGRRHAECMPAVICDVCNNSIRAGTPKMKAMNKVFHPECFRCTSCNQQIHSEFTNRSGKPICLPCSQATHPKCARCYNPITGQYVAFGSTRFHHECFCCSQCSARLSLDAFYTNQDKNYCQRCINAIVQ